MKQSFLYAWCLSAAGCASLLHAQSVSQFPDSGPETTLDSLWAATGHMQAFSDAIDSQMGVHRFQDGKKSRFWFSGMGSFGNASVRNEHSAFDYSAGGGALGYDYCASESGREGCSACPWASCPVPRTSRKWRTIPPDFWKATI